MRLLVAKVLEEAGYGTRQAATGEAALDAARAVPRPDLCILDVRLPQLSGYGVALRLREEFADEIAIVFLSGERIEPLDQAAGLNLGGDDYLVKPFAPEDLVARVDRLVSRSQTGRGRSDASGLTERELEVVRLLAEGLKQREIAKRLVVSPKTIATHTRNALNKLDVRTQAEAVAVAFRQRLIRL
jgi:DNA-binding NarL/FixJ family response regulator